MSNVEGSATFVSATAATQDGVIHAAAFGRRSLDATAPTETARMVDNAPELAARLSALPTDKDIEVKFAMLGGTRT